MAEPNQDAPVPPIELDELSYKYGVEFEMVLAFHEEELEVFLDSNQEIIKVLPYDQRSKTPFNRIEKYHPDRPYNSWGIKTKGKVEPYLTLPLEIASGIVGNAIEKQCIIHLDANPEEKHNVRYRNWHVTAEHSVRGVGTEGIYKRLGDRIASLPNARDWDSYGIEVVSPVLNSGDSTGPVERATITTALKGSKESTHGAFITNLCGMHIHVEAPLLPSGDIDLRLLQHLGFLTLIYETQISSLHPPCRHPGRPNTISMLDSNRRTICFLPGSSDVLAPIPGIRARVMATRDVNELVTLMSAFCKDWGGFDYRGFLVNWQYLLRRDNQPQTLEWRQHRGTLDVEDVEFWRDFVAGMVKIARRRARMDEQGWTAGIRIHAKSWTAGMGKDAEVVFWQWKTNEQSATGAKREQLQIGVETKQLRTVVERTDLEAITENTQMDRFVVDREQEWDTVSIWHLLREMGEKSDGKVWKYWQAISDKYGTVQAGDELDLTGLEELRP